MDIRIFKTSDEASIYCAAIIEQVIKSRENPVLGLATGSTPIQLYRRLADMHQWGLDFSDVRTINLDEYVGLSADHPQSYRYFMQNSLFNYININPLNRHIPKGDAQDLQEECKRYDRIIKENPIDIQVLGIGINGHIGFNEPNSSLKSGTNIVELSQETIQVNARFFNDPKEVPSHAITMGVKSILTSKQIILLAFGEEKAQAVLEAYTGDIRTSLPASILQLHPNVTFVLDEASAKYLLSNKEKLKAVI